MGWYLDVHSFSVLFFSLILIDRELEYRYVILLSEDVFEQNFLASGASVNYVKIQRLLVTNMPRNELLPIHM